MNKMKRRICAALLMVLAFAVCPMQAFAAGPIDPAQNVTLNISYKDSDAGIPDARFSVYKVADVDKNVRMALTADFEAYKSTVSGLADLDHLTQEQWLALASTLKGYVQKDQISPAAEGKTDSDGNLSISDLKAGLYLVIASRATTSDYYTYSCVPFMLFLPFEDPVNNDWNYTVTAEPKSTKDYDPPDDDDDHITRKVLKKWDDVGYEALRPAEVNVQLLKDGKVFDTQTLNKDNNWRYAWDNLEADHDWDVVEKEIEGYAVSIARSGITFTVTNKYVAPICGTNLPIQKRINGDKPKENSTFVFLFSAKDSSSPMPEGSSGTTKEITIPGAGSREIGEITFEKAGTYVYTVSEKNGGTKGYTYDSTIYTVTYEVTEKDGELAVTTSIRNDKGAAASAIEFTNSYKTPGERLPQTGILWWPVPILLCVGSVFVMIGMIRRRRCRG